ncbi:MAG TPA: adenylate/guanylate cyclase domain-containing protein, partial [Candidatus Ozemobacteraceae bacterium]|nr:adenylate/guanylate cyclase domain-containing protein [Candidatus Ozemobacteraceae bacterium]
LNSAAVSGGVDYQGVYTPSGLKCQQDFGRELSTPLAVLFRTLGPSLLHAANPELSAGSKIPAGLFEMSQTFMNEYMEMDSFGYYLGNPNRLCRTPYGNVQTWYQIRFLRPDVKQLAHGVLINYGNYSLLRPSLDWFMKGVCYRLSDPEKYQLDLYLLRYHNLINRTVAQETSSFQTPDSAYSTCRTLAESSLKHLVPRSSSHPDIHGQAEYLAQPLTEDFAIGAARASPRQSLSRRQTLFVIVLLLSLCVFLYSLISTTTWYLLRPLKAFLQATAQAAQGVFTWRLDLRTSDECETMATELNQMAVKLVERQRMTRFVSDDMVKAIAEKEEQAIRPGGQAITTTVLVSDIRSFTTLSEQHPPEAIVAALNEYFTTMEEAIQAEQGIIVQMIGDAIVAHFPTPSADLSVSVPRGIRAALAMRRALREYNSERLKKGLFCLRTGIGIAAGEVLSAVVGSATGRLGYTLIGTVVDRAVDLETFSKQGHSSGIMIDHSLVPYDHDGLSLLPTSDKQACEISLDDPS